MAKKTSGGAKKPKNNSASRGRAQATGGGSERKGVSAKYEQAGAPWWKQYLPGAKS